MSKVYTEFEKVYGLEPYQLKKHYPQGHQNTNTNQKASPSESALAFCMSDMCLGGSSKH